MTTMTSVDRELLGRLHSDAVKRDTSIQVRAGCQSLSACAFLLLTESVYLNTRTRKVNGHSAKTPVSLRGRRVSCTLQSALGGGGGEKELIC